MLSLKKWKWSLINKFWIIWRRIPLITSKIWNQMGDRLKYTCIYTHFYQKQKSRKFKNIQRMKTVDNNKITVQSISQLILIDIQFNQRIFGWRIFPLPMNIFLTHRKMENGFSLNQRGGYHPISELQLDTNNI